MWTTWTFVIESGGVELHMCWDRTGLWRCGHERRKIRFSTRKGSKERGHRYKQLSWGCSYYLRSRTCKGCTRPSNYPFRLGAGREQQHTTSTKALPVPKWTCLGTHGNLGFPTMFLSFDNVLDVLVPHPCDHGHASFFLFLYPFHVLDPSSTLP